jgi:hypothetical protein
MRRDRCEGMKIESTIELKGREEERNEGNEEKIGYIGPGG